MGPRGTPGASQPTLSTPSSAKLQKYQRNISERQIPEGPAARDTFEEQGGDSRTHEREKDGAQRGSRGVTTLPKVPAPSSYKY